MEGVGDQVQCVNENGRSVPPPEDVEPTILMVKGWSGIGTCSKWSRRWLSQVIVVERAFIRVDRSRISAEEESQNNSISSK